ncbi:eosinophil peroxidase-like [Bufo bufo]|uniref:eosinophil peroxidase-like n=1 Tax=Bufo bufo TaxID=8384 RepID=UPI001ABEB2FE|nr:eosinophil peroxidase-like [Bufo bufo]
MVNYMNMQFTHKFGGDRLEFLDVEISVREGELVTEGYRKPTATNLLLHYSSYHAPSVKKAVPYGQFVRLKQINRLEVDYNQQALELKNRLLARGYPLKLLNQAMKKAAYSKPRISSTDSENAQTEGGVAVEGSHPFVFSFKYGPMASQIRKVIKDNWSILERDESLKDIKNVAPIIAFRRCHTLKDKLVRSRFQEKKPMTWLENWGPKGNHGEKIQLDDSVIRESVEEAKKRVDSAYVQTRKDLKERSKREAPRLSDIMAFFKQAVGAARNIIRSADYLEVTRGLINEKLKIIYPNSLNVSAALTEEQNQIISQLTGCAYQFLPKVCDPSPYRSITGECNNRKHAILGASSTAYKRLLKPEYEDGISLPLGWTQSRPINGFTLPLAREVSNEIVKLSTESLKLDDGRSLMFMQWGQWLDHDLDLSVATPTTSSFLQNVNCAKSCVNTYPCFPLMIPPTDPRYVNGSECISMIRTASVCSLTSPVREQINGLTSFIDGSQVYGSDQNIATLLRNKTNQLGLLAVNQNFTDNGFPYLPFSGNGPDLCSRTNPTLGVPCFVAGDSRSNEQPMLTTFHTLFLREHNRIATQLRKLNPRWSGETLYQETRKIIGAMLQKITYKDWLPLLLGNEMSKVLPPYTSYDEDEDPRVSNVFTIAFRMGHTMVQPFIYRLANNFSPYSPEPVVPLHETFFASWIIVRNGGIDPLLRGTMVNKAKLNRQDQIMVDELRERLFPVVNRIGRDLASFNIQRGRDHGLPGYNAWRRYCGLSAPRNVDELAAVLNNQEVAEKLIDLYGTPENIDIWVGGVSEPLVPNGRTGQLLSCLIGNQFRRARNGDSFFYENLSVFSLKQRKSIEEVTLAHIICANTKIKQVPRNVFLANEFPADFIDCSKFAAMDLSPWKA